MLGMTLEQFGGVDFYRGLRIHVKSDGPPLELQIIFLGQARPSESCVQNSRYYFSKEIFL